MAIYEVKDKKSIFHLFDGWEETMIWSCLQDCMGTAYADDLHNPTSAQIVIGGFSFFAGKSNDELIGNDSETFFIMASNNSQWDEGIERVYGNKVARRTRYATKKEKDVFDVLKLEEIVRELSSKYEMKMIEEELYKKIISSDWAVDLCANYKSYDDFAKNGLGVVILSNGEILAGASSYTFYNSGIEIEIDTRHDMRRKGLALACGAKLILECLSREIYPSWDAHNAGSLALAQKLGYSFDKEYPTYEFV